MSDAVLISVTVPPTLLTYSRDRSEVSATPFNATVPSWIVVSTAPDVELSTVRPPLSSVTYSLVSPGPSTTRTAPPGTGKVVACACVSVLITPTVRYMCVVQYAEDHAAP